MSETQNINKRLLWLSNAPWAATGYGNQTGLFVPRLKRAGFEMFVNAFYGLEGGVMNWGDIPVLPKGLLPYGQDIAAAHANYFEIRYILSLVDAWVFNNSPFYESLINERVRWLAWFPVDSDPLPPPVLEAVRRAYKRIVFSRFAERMVNDAGLDCHYIPHGINTKALYPLPMSEARKHLRDFVRIPVPDDAFLVGMVAANKGFPSRKAFAEQIQAFSIFKKKHSDALLYLHTSDGEMGEFQGVNLPEYIASVGLRVGKDVLFPPRYNYFMGFPDEFMRNLYSAMDVHLLASTGEGFGIPIVEAQACGTPVIVGDWTAMPELCFSGWKVKECHPYWTLLASYQYLPEVGAVVDALEAAYNMRGNDEYRKRAEKGAKAYDADRVTEKYWIPFLTELFEDDRLAELEMEAVRKMAQKRIET